MNAEASYFMDVAWGDTALANFFGPNNAARFSGADQMSSAAAFATKEPESLASLFVTDAFGSINEAQAEVTPIVKAPERFPVALAVLIGVIAFVILFRVRFV